MIQLTHLLLLMSTLFFLLGISVRMIDHNSCKWVAAKQPRLLHRSDIGMWAITLYLCLFNWHPSRFICYFHLYWMRTSQQEYNVWSLRTLRMVDIIGKFVNFSPCVVHVHFKRRVNTAQCIQVQSTTIEPFHCLCLIISQKTSLFSQKNNNNNLKDKCTIDYFNEKRLIFCEKIANVAKSIWDSVKSGQLSRTTNPERERDKRINDITFIKKNKSQNRAPRRS